MMVAGTSLGLMLFAALQANDYLVWHSWVLYLAQAVVIGIALRKRLQYASDFFLPSLFVLIYFTVNLVLGGYLVPRDFGWNKEFSTTVLAITHYRQIVPYLLACNFVLYVLTVQALRAMPRDRLSSPGPASAAMPVAPTLLASVLLLGAGLAPIESAFSLELAIAILLFSSLARRRVWYRSAVYVACLGAFAALSYQNKREIVMMLFLVCFLEAHFGAVRMRLSLKNLLLASAAAAAFFGLVMVASILRGYGDLEISTALEAAEVVPAYMSSEAFVDGITDNLELNYHYGVTVTAMDYGIRGLIDLQYGATLFKVFFLPIPRDLVPFKPESMLQLFTQAYAPDWWAEEGSMPVSFSADMYLNFRYFGLLVFGFIMFGVNKIYLKYFAVAPQSFAAYSCLFLVITVLMFARGSGIEQWLYYYLVAAPVFLGVNVFRASLRALLDEERRWLV